MRRIRNRISGLLEKTSKGNYSSGGLANKAIYIFLSLLYLHTSRFLGNLSFIIVLVISAVIVYFSKDSIKSLRKHNLFNLLIAFYGLWITISYLMHYFALVSLDRLSYITVDGNTIFWGLATLNQSTANYLLFPLLLFLLIGVFRVNSDLHKWLSLSPVLFLPSTILSLYQAYIDRSFLYPHRYSSSHIVGFSTDASAFGISLFFLFIFSVLGFLTTRKILVRILYAGLGFIQIWCLILRGQRTTFIGILLFLCILPLVYHWMNRKKSRSYWLKFLGIYLFSFLLMLGIGIQTIQNEPDKNLKLLSLFYKYIQDHRENRINLLSENFVIGRVIYGKKAVEAISASPISGWGPGGFYRILPDLVFRNKQAPIKNHNAANHYLQIGSEFGILGLWLNLALHLIPIWMVFAIRNKIQKREEKWAVAITVSALAILLVIYMTGPHGMAKDVLWLIVTLIAYIYVMAMRYGHRFSQISYKKVSAILIFLTIIFVAGTYNSSFGEKGYKAKQQSDWWPLKTQYGFYSFENWKDGPMRWTMHKAQVRVKPESDLMSFKVVAHSPNSQEPKGLKFRFFLNDNLLDEIHFFNGGSQTRYYYIPHIKNQEVEIQTEVSKTFNPRLLGISRDPRELGVAMSPITYLKIMPNDGVGFHNWETSGNHGLREWPQDRPLKYRTTGMRGSINLKSELQNGGMLFLRCGHPNIGDNPVQVNILADRNLIKQEIFADYNWKKVIVKKEEITGAKGLTLQVSRTWNPKLLGISDDGRDLGVAVALSEEKS